MKTRKLGTWFAGIAVGFVAGSAWAVDPIPDWKTLVMPCLLPKAGHGRVVPAGLDAGSIRYSYDTRFENYWKEVSYYRYDTTTGLKQRGFYNEAKTYGYIQLPWPIQPRGAFNNPTPGQGEGFTDGARRYSANANTTPYDLGPDADLDFYIADGADNDGFWTPGESFEDLNGNRQWDPPAPAEDYWNNNNTQQFLQKRSAAGAPLGTLASATPSTLFLPYRNQVQNTAAWSSQAGELFADYNDDQALFSAVGAVGFESSVPIYVAAGGVQQLVAMNELDLTPTDNASVNEGDFIHTVVVPVAPPNNLGVPGTDIPRNGEFDYTADHNNNPQVRAATYTNGQNVLVRYPSYVQTNATTEAAGYVFTSKDSWPGAGAPPDATYVVRTITVQVYQTEELYGNYHGTFIADANEYGDEADINGNPVPRTVAVDDTWTAMTEGEPFEDFVSWGSYLDVTAIPGFVAAPWYVGQVLNDATEGRGRGGVVTWAAYEAYIRWNYPGDDDALLARAGNGTYDGPERWTNAGNNKVTLGGGVGDVTPEPVTIGVDAHWWSGFGPPYDTWNTWYSATFGQGVTAAPAWNATILAPVAYTPVDEPAGAGWIPVNTWSYDSTREFCDLPSSMYHLGGDPANGITLIDVDGDPIANPEALNQPVRIIGGDNALGEVTSPWNDEIYGEALWYETLGGDNPQHATGSIPSAGPFAYNTLGTHGYDGANLLNLELLTRRTDGQDGVDRHPLVLRDTNLDGIVDTGPVRTGDPHYSTSPGGNVGGDGSGDYPFNRQRFMEDCVAIWDQAEDFAQIDSAHDVGGGIYGYPIYPTNPDEATNAGWAALGGPAGANIDVLTRDRVAAVHIVFQVRPMNGAFEVEPANYNPNTDPVAPRIQDFGMGLLCHEQSHDIGALPDLYDYDSWQNPGGAILNGPIASYDLMAGGFVHGVADMKEWWGWVTPIDLTTVVTNYDPVVLNFYPAERIADQYYRLLNPKNPAEYLDLWFVDTRNANEPGPDDVPGGRGLYIAHMDRSYFVDPVGNPNALPRQQRINNHFVWEIVQADGLAQLQDSVNRGDTGDPFPGATDRRTYTPDTIPAARWWDQTDTGLRILNIELPVTVGQPAKVTIALTEAAFGTPAGVWTYPHSGADTDGDSIPDFWEYHYFTNLATAGTYSDFDGDGLTDLAEFNAETNPRLRDTDNDGIIDSADDQDGDTLTNLQEAQAGTNPLVQDTDHDGIRDDKEDSDADGLTNAGETVDTADISDMGLSDTDDDGVMDSVDVKKTDSMILPKDLVLDLNGAAGSYVQMPQNDRFALQSFTLAAWVRPEAGGGGLITRGPVGGNNVNYELSLTGDRVPQLRIYILDPAGPTWVERIVEPPAHIVLPVNEWTHLAATVDVTTRRAALYVNSIEVMSEVITLGADRTWNQIWQGVGGSVRIGEGFQGQLDEVAIYKAALNSTEIYAALDGVDTDHQYLVSYLRFDDGTSASGPNANGFWPGTSGRANIWWGQVEEFAPGYPRDWETLWGNAGTLFGQAQMKPVDAKAPVKLSLKDSDGDGLPDWWELLNGLNPATIDSDGDGTYDGQEDADNDSLSNRDEFQIFVTRPDAADTDDDGVTDDYELGQIVFDPLNSLSPLKTLSLNFAGSSGYLEPVRSHAYNSTDMTVEAWISPTTANLGAARTIISRAVASGTQGNYALGLLADGRPYFSIAGAGGGASVVSGTVPVPMDAMVLGVTNWVHLTGSYNNQYNRMKLYVGDTQVATRSGVSAGAVSTQLTPSMKAGENYFGLLDALAIWNAERQPTSEILTGTESNLVAYFRMDDGTSGTPGADAWWGALPGLDGIDGTPDDIPSDDTFGPDGIQGTADDVGPDGVAGTTDDPFTVTRGQVENFVHSQDWILHWANAATLHGTVSYFTNRFFQLPALTDDTDSDRMSDDMESLFGLLPLQDDAGSDPDFDGWPSGDEFFFGLNQDGTFSGAPSPVNLEQYPIPPVTFRIHYTGTSVGPLGIEAFHASAMNTTPDASILEVFGAVAGVKTVTAWNPVDTDANDEVIGTTVAGDSTYSGAFAHGQVAPGSVAITVGNFQLTDDGNGNLTGDAGETGTINYSTGAWSIQLGAAGLPAAGTRILADYTYSAPQGHLWAGNNWFWSYKDANDNGVFDVGEPAGLSQEPPYSVGWDGAGTIPLNLRENIYGFKRFQWTAPATLPTYYRVIVRWAAASGTMQVSIALPPVRNYIHEWDIVQAGFPNGLWNTGDPSYQWFVYAGDTSALIASGNFAVPMLAPGATTPLTAAGTIFRQGVNSLAWTEVPQAVRYELEVRKDSSAGTLLLAKSFLAPVPISGTTVQYTLPVLGEGAYVWRVRATNAKGAGAWSDWRTFRLDLTTAASGPYSISGAVFYSGKVTDATFQVEAFRTRSFTDAPLARLTVTKTASSNELIAAHADFSLRGLPAGAYYVRAYLDSNGNGACDAWESYGFVAQTTPVATPFRAEALTVGPSVVGRTLIVYDRDTDNDRLPDAFEWMKNGNLTTSGPGSVRGWTDRDNDGLNDFEEYFESPVDSDWAVSDTDGDGLPDGLEVLLYGTNARVSDTDGDGVPDKIEIDLGANPLLTDTDGDGVPDGLEITLGSSLLKSDTDGDGFADILEAALGSDPKVKTSRPAKPHLLRIDDIRRVGTQMRVDFGIEDGNGQLARRVRAILEASDTIGGAWKTVTGGAVDLPAGATTAQPFALPDNSAGEPKLRIYRLRWELAP